jgi:hypothetical protein
MLLVAVVAAALLASAVGFLVVGSFAPEAARTRLYVDIGLVVLLALIAEGLTHLPAERTRELVDAVRALTLGGRDQRLDASRFGDLADLARALNELAALQGESEDPSVGVVRTRRRSSPDRQERPLHSDHPELGDVRVLPRPAPRSAPALEPTSPLKSPVSPRAGVVIAMDVVGAVHDAPKEAELPTRAAGAARPETPDTRRLSEEQPGKPDDQPGRPGDDSTIPMAPGITADPSSMHALFDEFMAAKHAHNEATGDLEFGAFRTALVAEGDRLKAEHGCREVRFEVTVRGGEVSLLPRLLR